MVVILCPYVVMLGSTTLQALQKLYGIHLDTTQHALTCTANIGQTATVLLGCPAAALLSIYRIPMSFVLVCH